MHYSYYKESRATPSQSFSHHFESSSPRKRLSYSNELMHGSRAQLYSEDKLRCSANHNGISELATKSSCACHCNGEYSTSDGLKCRAFVVNAGGSNLNIEEYTRERDYWKSRFLELEVTNSRAMEQIRASIMEECKIILEQELKDQAAGFAQERLSLEQMLAEASTKTADIEVRLAASTKEYEEMKIMLKRSEAQTLDLSDKLVASEKAGQIHSEEMRVHYEEMIRLAEERINREARDRYHLKKVHLKGKIKILEEQLLQQEGRIEALLQEVEQLRARLNIKENEIREIHVNYLRSREEFEAESKRIKKEEISRFEAELFSMRDKLRLYEGDAGLYKRDVSELEKLLKEREKEIQHWKSRYETEIFNARPVIQSVPVHEPVRIVEASTTRIERELIDEKILLERELNELRAILVHYEHENKRLSEDLYARDEEIHRLKKTLDGAAGAEIQKSEQHYEMAEEINMYLKERDELIRIINSYRQYMKDLELIVSIKNRNLLEKIHLLDDEFSRQEVFLKMQRRCLPEKLVKHVALVDKLNQNDVLRYLKRDQEATIRRLSPKKKSIEKIIDDKYKYSPWK